MNDAHETLLQRTEDLRARIKARKEALYRLKQSRPGLNTDRITGLSAELLRLELRASDLWECMYHSGVSEVVGAEKFHLLELEFEEILAEIEG